MGEILAHRLSAAPEPQTRIWITSSCARVKPELTGKIMMAPRPTRATVYLTLLPPIASPSRAVSATPT